MTNVSPLASNTQVAYIQALVWASDSNFRSRHDVIAAPSQQHGSVSGGNWQVAYLAIWTPATQQRVDFVGQQAEYMLLSRMHFVGQQAKYAAGQAQFVGHQAVHIPQVRHPSKTLTIPITAEPAISWTTNAPTRTKLHDLCQRANGQWHMLDTNQMFGRSCSLGVAAVWA